MSRSIPKARLEGTTAADLIFSVRVRAADAGGEIDDLDLAGVNVTFTIQDGAGADRIQASLGKMITLTGDPGVFTVQVPKATMSSLEPGDYAIGCTIANAAVNCQLFTGLLTVKDGVNG
jgi:hypothetical protein